LEAGTRGSAAQRPAPRGSFKGAKAMFLVVVVIIIIILVALMMRRH
jgi:hypothetical protein